MNFWQLLRFHFALTICFFLGEDLGVSIFAPRYGDNSGHFGHFFLFRFILTIFVSLAGMFIT